VFLIVAVGYTLRRLRVLTAEADASLLRLTLTLLYPAFIIDHLLGNDQLSGALGALVAAGTGATFILLSFGVAFLVGALVCSRDENQRRTFAVAVGLQNYSFIPIPIILALFDHGTIGVHLMHTVGVEIALWTVGVMLLTGGRAGAWKNLLNGPLLTTVACLVANSLGLGDSLHPVAANAATTLGACAVPLSLLLIGATIRDLFRVSDTGAKTQKRAPQATAAIAIRLLFVPAAMLLVAKYLPLSLDLKRVLVIQAAMPCAVFPIILAKRYDGDAATALRVVVATSIVAIFTIPPAIVFGLWFTGAAG
jgi:predicted permease